MPLSDNPVDPGAAGDAELHSDHASAVALAG
jgi:hypothetical protein